MNLNLAKYLDRYVGIILCYVLAALHLIREMIAPRESWISVRRILLVKFWGFGNIVLLLPIFRLIRRRYPRAEIHLLTLEANRQILTGNTDLDKVWTVDDSGGIKLASSMLKALVGLRKAKIDLFLDFEQFARTSTLFGFLIGAPQRVGLKTPRQGRYLLYTAPVNYDDEQHMSRTFLDIARSAGVQEDEFTPMPVPWGDEEDERVDGLLAGVTGPLVVVHVGSGDNFTGRRWPGESFARLTDRLIGRFDVVPVFTGAKGEVSLVRDVLAKMKFADRAMDLSGQLNLRELAALIERSEFLLANDTGPVHMASGQGKKVLGFYGPNTPVLYGPLSEGSRAFYKALPCSPCITNLNYKTSFCRLPVCIRNISVDEVFTEAVRILTDGPGVVEQAP